MNVKFDPKQTILIKSDISRLKCHLMGFGLVPMRTCPGMHIINIKIPIFPINSKSFRNMQ